MKSNQAKALGLVSKYSLLLALLGCAQVNEGNLALTRQALADFIAQQQTR